MQSTKPTRPKIKRKTVYFVKSHPVKLENENINKEVLHGELTEAPLETLSAVAQSVFLPLLSSANNQEGWPDVLARVTENLHKFVANGECQAHVVWAAVLLGDNCCVATATPSQRAPAASQTTPSPSLQPPHRIPTPVKVSIGEAKGQTLLPLPATDPSTIAAAAAAAAAATMSAAAAPASMASTPAAAGGGEAAAPARPGHLPLADAEKVHILEQAVLTWTRQIKKVLQADPDAPLKVCKESVGQASVEMCSMFWQVQPPRTFESTRSQQLHLTQPTRSLDPTQVL